MDWNKINYLLKKHKEQLFTVPNTPEGRLFIELARKYLTKSYNLRLRGRNLNKEKYRKLNKGHQYFPHQHVPLNSADNIGVYLHSKFTSNGMKFKNRVTGVHEAILLEEYRNEDGGKYRHEIVRSQTLKTLETMAQDIKMAIQGLKEMEIGG